MQKIEGGEVGIIPRNLRALVAIMMVVGRNSKRVRLVSALVYGRAQVLFFVSRTDLLHITQKGDLVPKLEMMVFREFDDGAIARVHSISALDSKIDVPKSRKIPVSFSLGVKVDPRVKVRCIHSARSRHFRQDPNNRALYS